VKNQSQGNNGGARGWRNWVPEAGGIGCLAALLAYFLAVSWRKWPDPIIDSGPQWYAFWRIAQGGMLFHEAAWNYGPLSAYIDGTLFKVFGTSLTVLFAANLTVYGAILGLAYTLLRRAWGRLGAFAACAVFISIFSFSHLTSVGNYNYAAPYSQETTHGMLLMLLTLLAAADWQRGRSVRAAFALGTCGGIAAVLKPEFILAAGMVGMAALALRCLRRIALSWQEVVLLMIGVVWPTMAFAVLFSRSESFGLALTHACNAWWVVLVHPIEIGGFAAGQRRFAGFDHPWRNGWQELKDGLAAGLVVGATWAGGWFVNRPAALSRIMVLLAFGGMALFVRLQGGWFRVGQCLPMLMVFAVVFYGARLVKQWRGTGRLEQAAVLRWFMALLAMALLARMALFARVYHFGFFQAALAGMVTSAMMMGEVPLWAGDGRAGRAVTASAALLVLAVGCRAIAAKSGEIRAGQTQPVGSGPDRFYAFDREIDPTGALVDWVVKHLDGTPPNAALLVLPEGLSINFLTRHVSPLPDVWTNAPEEVLVEQLRKGPPDYVALLSLNLAEHGVERYGAPGNPGRLLVEWVKQNYVPIASWGEPFSGTRLKGATVLRGKKEEKP